MGLEALTQIGSAIGKVFGGISGVGTILVLAGIIILLVIGIGFGLYILAQVIRQIPRMSPWQFLKFVILSATALIVLGIILP